MTLSEELAPFALSSSEKFGELTVTIAADRLVETCRFLKDALRFERLSTMTAVDRYPSEPRFEVVYHLHSIEPIRRVRVKCRVSGINPEMDSVYSVWRAADWYEREMFDMFGIGFRNHPNLVRILMPLDWEGHPLRKDYPVHGYKYGYAKE